MDFTGEAPFRMVFLNTAEQVALDAGRVVSEQRDFRFQGLYGSAVARLTARALADANFPADVVALYNANQAKTPATVPAQNGTHYTF